ncbi:MULTISPECIES: hypothetical protein [unclassified Bosea (in: a-proteobacteria)]|uniref:hypothetical protein n=1 Tax=unclassified Bosea (in: a-proteobacteria) TaxID=2653178 RepID=UPI0009556A07|nr:MULTISPECIES: hypothetical protein [unclassified Bosea (in: a-proteobacteria)]TAJ31600.1 MAG: hypothetical protein EPO59_07785 [Bosea sp. (in: a-proteobacteria)]SIR34724.1 hypothetical protein SAMN05880592_1172 [Bosea sp. TND4EK4]
MPQIWLTYDEMSEAFDIPRHVVRDTCAELGLARMRSSDGTTRARLSPGLMHQYLSTILAQHAGEPTGARHEQIALEMILKGQEPQRKADLALAA